MWLDNLRTVAGLGTALGVDNIIGIDIFNEPHDYTWAEWKSLTEQAYTAINAVNPNTLLFVQGIGTNAGTQDGTPTTITSAAARQRGDQSELGREPVRGGREPDQHSEGAAGLLAAHLRSVGVRAEDVHGSGADAVHGARG